MNTQLNFIDSGRRGLFVENWPTFKKELLSILRKKASAFKCISHEISKDKIVKLIQCELYKEATINMCTLLEAKLRIAGLNGKLYEMLTVYTDTFYSGKIKDEDATLLHHLRMDRNAYIHFTDSKHEFLNKHELLKCLDLINKIK